MLYAAHNATGRVLVYDTVAQAEAARSSRSAQAPGSCSPSIRSPNCRSAPGAELRRQHGLADRRRRGRGRRDRVQGDEEAYGVNFSSQAPDKAFVMNRDPRGHRGGRHRERRDHGAHPGRRQHRDRGDHRRRQVDRRGGERRRQVVVIDAVTNEIVKTFEDVGKYPWSVTIPNGQNYCH